MVYPTNPNGNSYFLPSNIHTLESDTSQIGRFYDANHVILQVREGEDVPEIEEVTAGVFTISEPKIFSILISSGNYDINSVNRTTPEKLGAGYMVNTNDWRNVEATIEVTYTGGGDTDAKTVMSISARGGFNWNLEEFRCESASYDGGLRLKEGETIFFTKQDHQDHGIQRFTVHNRFAGDLINRQFLFKFIIYDIKEDGQPTLVKSEARFVKMEIWASVDAENDYAEMFKLAEAIDNGGWSDGGERCDGAEDQILLWGGNIVDFFFGSDAEINFSRLSVREIDASSTFNTPQPPPTNPPPTTDPPTNNPPPEPPINTTDVNDSLGVRKIYRSKQGGSIFIHNVDGLITNSKFDPAGANIVYSGNGSYRVTGNVDMRFCSTEVARNRPINFEYNTFDYEELRTRGFWDSSTDFNNCEITMYIRHLGGTNITSEYSIIAQSVNHQSSFHGGCGGSAYQGNLEIAGFISIDKEGYHGNPDVALQTRKSTSSIGDVTNRWIGVKFVTYNITLETRKLEIWIDQNNSNNWVKFFETTDNNDWIAAMSDCGALRDGQAITWGSPYVILHAVGKEFDIAKVSVREISLPVERVTNSDLGGSTGGGTGGGGGGAGLLDNNNIRWLFASGEMLEIAQSRNDPGDFRWSEVFSGLRNGYECTAYMTFSGTNSSAHMALKHFGGNHSGNCQYEEGGSCCCWYDTGIRHDGAIQTQIERPHPNNDDWACPTCLMSNIGIGMEGNTIGLKWLVYPITENGNVDNGGVKIKMWVDTSGFDTSGRPKNNWRLVYDITDTGQIMDNYPAPDEQEIEIRNSDTDNTDVYTDRVWARRLVRPGDITGNQNPPDPGGGGGGGDPGGGTGGGTDPPDPPDNPGTGTPSRQVSRYVMMHDNLIDRSGTVCAADQTPPPIVYSEHYSVTTITDDQELGDPMEAHNNRLRIVEYCANNTSMLYGRKYAKVEFYLKKVGAPTGTIYFEMYDDNAENPNIKVEYGTIDVATGITTSYVLYSRTNDNAPSLVPEGMNVGWSIGIRFDPTFASDNDYVVVGQNWDNPIDSTNSHIAEWEDSNNDGDYAYDTPFHTDRDLCGKLYTIV